MEFNTRKKVIYSFYLLFLFHFFIRVCNGVEGKSIEREKRNALKKDENFNVDDYDSFGSYRYFDLKSNLQKKNDLSAYGESTTENEGVISISKSESKSNDKVIYIGCIDAWNHITGENGTKFDDSFDHEKCAMYCKTEDSKNQISLLRGGDCRCKNSNSYDYNRSHFNPNSRCNVPCPVSSPINFSEGINNCGGNIYYSVYCHNDGSLNCSYLQKEVQGFLSKEVNNNVLGDFGKLHMQCASCNDFGCSSSFLSPYFDYFPRNKPEDADGCVMFCKIPIPYKKMNQTMWRNATKYALLLWQNDPINQKPICQCSDEINKYFEQEPSRCTAKCPGDPSATCGSKYIDYPLFATIYCVHDHCHNDSEEITDPTPFPQYPCSTLQNDPGAVDYFEIDCNSSISSSTTVTSTSTKPSSTTVETPTTTRSNATTIITTTTEDDVTLTSKETTETSMPTTSSTPSTTMLPLLETNCPLCEGVDLSTQIKWSICAGNYLEIPCGHENAYGIAIWKCSLNAEFETEQPDYSGCHSTWIEEIEAEIEKIIDRESALKYLTTMKDIIKTSPEEVYFGHEINNITVILGLAVKKTESFDITSKDFEELAVSAISVTETLITTQEPWLQLDSKSRSKSSSKLLKAIENTSLKLSAKVKLEPQGSYKKQLSREPLFRSLYYVSAGALSNLNGEGSKDTLEFPQTRLASQSFIKLPQGWKENITGNKIEFVGSFLNSDFANLMMPGQYSRLGITKNPKDKNNNPNKGQWDKIMNGKLMSFTLASSELNGMSRTDSSASRILTKTGKVDEDKDNFIVYDIQFRDTGVQITFEHDIEAWGDAAVDIQRKLYPGEKPKAALGTSQCVFWDTNNLTWSTKGCKIISSSRYRTVCECNHLTSFAVLMDVHNYNGKDLGLEILTLLLCSLSFISLFISIIIFSIIRGVQNLRTTITKNLSICLLLGNTMILLVVDRNYMNLTEGLCVASGIMTHYVFLAAFLWMIIEGIHLYKMVVHVFDTENNPMNIYRLVAYGLPLIVVAVTVSTGYLKGDRPYGGDVVCWLEGHYIWSFLAPVAVVVIVNLIILFIALKTAYQLQHNSKLPIHQSRVRSYRTWIKGCFSITVLLGLTWLLGFFTLIPASPGLVAAYLFVIFNASQGIFIFVFHCVLNDKVRMVTQKRFGNYLPSWLSVSFNSTGSDGNENNGPDFGKKAVSNMNRSAFSISRNGINKSSMKSTTTGTGGSQTSCSSTKVRPKFEVSKSGLINGRNEVCMDQTGGTTIVMSPKPIRNFSLRRRDSFGESVRANSLDSMTTSESDKSVNSLRGLISDKRKGPK